ncbi:MAG: hypothetical protein ACKVOJ_11500 [Sphingomonadaceae bacterium]
MKTAFDFPGVPALDKTSIPNATAFICALLFLRPSALAPPRQPIVLSLIVLFIISPLATVLTNADPINLSESSIPGMTLYDALSLCVEQAVLLIPFLLGYNVLRGDGGQNDILRALAIAGLLYSLPMLFEVRMSPQLHAKLYGFFPASFGQQMRFDGFRPVVFMGHGLLVAIFCCVALLTMVGQWRAGKTVFGISAGIASAYLAAVLYLCKSFGAIGFAIIFAPLLYLAKPRQLVWLSAVLAIILISYPALRGSGLIPVEEISSLAKSLSTDREASLAVRLENEEVLLQKANKRPAFGWGTYGRNRIYDEDTGADESLTDGTWIIMVGTYGWVGYLACFGLLCFPLIAPLGRPTARGKTPLVTATLTIILAVNLLDLIPNSSLTPITWLIAGALSAPALRPRTQKPRGKDEDADNEAVPLPA